MRTKVPSGHSVRGDPLDAFPSSIGDRHRAHARLPIAPGRAESARLSVVPVGDATHEPRSTSAPMAGSPTAPAPPLASEPGDPFGGVDAGYLLFPRPQAFWVRLAVRAHSHTATFAPWQLAVKRALDVLFGTVLLLLCLPLLAIAALAIKLSDSGPVFFRQTRVGRDGRLFTILKLRTMVPGADKHLHLLAAGNARTGPLFKMPADPRVTPVGRLLRSSSIDELPQLLNVIGGTMSLVGPRPALPAEVAQFDQRLMVRLDVKPGITGLWQVEARDDPAFERYQKLDLYYVRNWSLRLDLAILLSTIRPVVQRLFRSARREAAT